MLYLMMKQHMTGKYDIIKYNWSMKVSDSAFAKRKDRYYFEKMARNHHLKDMVETFLAVFIENPSGWAGDLVSDEAAAARNELKGRLIRLSDVYREDIKNIVYFGEKLDIPLGKVFEYNKDKLTSPIFKLLQSGLVHIETFLLIDSFLGIIDAHNKASDDIIWQAWYSKLSGYRKLVVINKDTAKLKFVELVKQFKTK